MITAVRRLRRRLAGGDASPGVRKLLSLGLPAGVSAAVHLALLAVLLTATVRVTTRAPRPAPPEGLTVTLRAPAPTIEMPAQTDGPAEPGPFVPGSGRTETLSAATPLTAARIAAKPATEVLAGAQARTNQAIERTKRDVGAGYAGASARRGERIVYVVDGSGPMVSCMGFVLDELTRSVNMLDAGQQFQVLLFAGRNGRPAVTSPLGVRTRLAEATAEAKRSVRDWASRVVAGGRSEPLAGLRAALALDPDVVFLLTRSIERTGGTGWGAGRSAILNELDRLNPRDARTGRRRAVIKCVQFLEPDTTGVMDAIARAHDPGFGADSNQTGMPYLLLTLDDLTSPAPERPAPSPAETDGLADAARELAELSVDGSDTCTLLGLVGGDSDRVREGAQRALAALDGIDDGPALAGVIRARARLLLHAAGGRTDLPTVRTGLESLPTDDRDPGFAADESGRLSLLALTEFLLGSDPGAVTAYADRAAGIDGGDALAVLEAQAAAMLFDPDPIRERLVQASAGSDALLSSLGARAIAQAWLQAGDPERAFAPLLTLEWDASWPLIAQLVDEGTDLEPLDERVVMAEALEALGDPSRVDDALALLDEVVARAPGTALGADALWRAAVTRLDAGREQPLAAEQLLRVYEIEPRTDRGRLAAAAALSVAHELGDAEAMIARALGVGTDFEGRASWRLELARLQFVRGAAIEGIERLSGVGAESAGEAWELARWGAERALAAVGDTERRRIALAAAGLGAELGFEAPRLRLAAALAIEVTAPDTAARELSALLEHQNGLSGEELWQARLGLARALVATGRGGEAVATVRPMLDESSAPTPAVGAGAFWEAWAIALEHAALAPDDLRLRVAHLRSLDPELGGEPWRSRIGAAGGGGTR